MTKNWYTDFNVQMYNRIKTRILKELGEAYSGLNIVRYEDNADLAVFPTVWIPDPTISSMGDTLETTVPDGITCMYQPEVYATDENEAEKIENAVKTVFCNMQFKQLAVSPLQDTSSSDVVRRVTRFQRVIGSADAP